jgi:hypothetical protein
MANAYATDKNFLVIEASSAEVISLGGMGICDSCEAASRSGHIVSVLAGRWYCPNCYQRWHAEAINYEEDHSYEKITFDRFIKMFSLLRPPICVHHKPPSDTGENHE